jgi:TRAP-type mannitol/chloroaromatic compound transport system substrate-binding protein
VLFSIPLKNKRFQFEIRNRPAKNRDFVYLNGPYLYAYHRDGKYIHETYFKKKNWNKLPRKVRMAMKPFLTPDAIAPYIEKIKAKHTEAQNLEAQSFGLESEEIPF